MAKKELIKLKGGEFMKNKKIFGLFLGLLGFPFVVHAAPTYSFSSSSTYITSGSTVTATLRINNVASWQVSLEGHGATSGCSASYADATDNAQNATKYFTVTCRATSVGQIGFTVTGNATSADGSTVSISGSKAVVVQAPREKDTNNYLKSLGVTGYTLSPSFDKEILEYTVTVPNTVNKVVIEAEKESSYATMENLGEVDVVEGLNSFEIKVVSETGSERIYTVKVNVEDESPIPVTIGNNHYTVMKNARTLEAPTTYLPTVIQINNFDIPAFFSEVSTYTLVGLKDSKGVSHLAIYDSENEIYTLYQENKSNELLLYLKEIPDEVEGFTKKNITINGNSEECLVSSIDPNIVLVYALNITTGFSDYYLYDLSNETYSYYNDAITKHYEEQIEKYQIVVLAFAGTLLFFFLVIILLLCRKPKNKNKNVKMEEKKEEVVTEEKKSKKQLKKERKEEKKKQKDLKQEVKEEVPVETKKEPKEKEQKKTNKKTKEDALEQVNNAAKIIEDYEKTRELSQKELKEIKEQVNEEEMFDLLADDKKRKKKNKSF